MASHKICLISSHGGHFRELMNIADEIEGEKYYVTHRTLQTEELLENRRHYFLVYPYKSILKYLRNGIQSLKHVLKEKPQFVVCTGAGSAVPTILLCKLLLRSKIIYIESAARVNTPSKTGKFLYEKTDLFLVQWPEMQTHFPKARFCGLL